MIVADEGRGRDDARAVARLVGLADLPECDWAQAPAELAGSAPALLMVEAAGVADATLLRVLPQVAALVRDAASAAVVALAADQIDLVSAHLLGPHVQLLCAPTLAERAGALVVARAAGAATLRDPAGDDEAARLAALAREVARLGTMLADLATRRDSAPRVGDRGTGFAGPPTDPGTARITAPEVRTAIRSRRLRDEEFGAGWFEDPAWDMLLDLYAAELEGTRVSVSSLCIAAAVAPTTALRWIAKMTAAGLLVREDDARDRRRAFMHLSDRARAGMVRYGAAIRQAGASVA